MKRPISIAIALTLACSSVARADSDGYFCVGKDYIAYQFGLAAPSVAPHRLTIVRFDSRGFGIPRVVELPQFQVHGMVCADDMVRVASFDTIHTVRLDSMSRPVGAIESEPLATRGKLPSEFASQRNLAAGSRPVSSLKPERLTLGRTANGHDLVLEISPKKSKAACVTDVTTRLIQVGARGRTVKSFPVFTGIGRRACGED